MTNTISPLAQTPLPLDHSPGGPSAKPAPSAPAASPESDSVTLSPAAQTTTQLLGAARGATGVDQQAVAQIRAAIAAGSYNVAPADLAQAIATVLKESN